MELQWNGFQSFVKTSSYVLLRTHKVGWVPSPPWVLAMIVHLPTGPKASGTRDHALAPRKPRTAYALSSFISHGDGKLTNGNIWGRPGKRNSKTRVGQSDFSLWFQQKPWAIDTHQIQGHQCCHNRHHLGKGQKHLVSALTPKAPRWVGSGLQKA